MVANLRNSWLKPGQSNERLRWGWGRQSSPSRERNTGGAHPHPQRSPCPGGERALGLQREGSSPLLPSVPRKDQNSPGHQPCGKWQVQAVGKGKGLILCPPCWSVREAALPPRSPECPECLAHAPVVGHPQPEPKGTKEGAMRHCGSTYQSWHGSK